MRHVHHLFAQAGKSNVDLKDVLAQVGGAVLNILKALNPGFLLGGPCAGAPPDPRQLTPVQILALLLHDALELLAGGFFLDELGVIACVLVQGAAVQLDGFVHDPVQEIAVVGDHQKSAPAVFQIFFEPGDGLIVQVVGGFVKDQEVAGGQEHRGHGHTLALAAGQGADGFVKVPDAQLGQDGFNLGFQVPQAARVNGIGQGQQVFLELFILRAARQEIQCALIIPQGVHLRGIGPKNLGQDGDVWVELGGLGQILDAFAAVDADFSRIGSILPGHNAQQGGFSSAVNTDDADFVAVLDAEVNFFKKGFDTVGFFKVDDG